VRYFPYFLLCRESSSVTRQEVSSSLRSFRWRFACSSREILDHRAVGGKLILKLRDILVGGLPLLLAHLFPDPADEYAAVPRSVENDDLPVGGDLQPETAEPGIAPLGGSRRRDGHHSEGTGIEPLGKHPDSTPLAGGGPPLENNRHWDAGLENGVFQLEELPLETRENPLIFFLGTGQIQVDLLEHLTLPTSDPTSS
jgi:hypothetical protein